jgi:hypothetical protein
MSLHFPTIKLVSSMAVAALVPGAGLATNVPDICDRTFARQVLASGDYAAFCGCDTVSTAFIQRIQGARDFTGVIDATLPLCPGLTDVLTQTVTASGPADNGPEPDGGGREPGTPDGDPETPGGDPGDPGSDPGDPDGDPGDPGGDVSNYNGF